MRTCPAPRVGIIGVGYWGSKHVRVLQTLDRVASVAVIDTDHERLRPLLKSFPSVRGFTSLDAALPHVDALVIAGDLYDGRAVAQDYRRELDRLFPLRTSGRKAHGSEP